MRHGQIRLNTTGAGNILSHVWKRLIHNVVSGSNRPKMCSGRCRDVPGTRRAHVWAFTCVFSPRSHAHLGKKTSSAVKSCFVREIRGAASVDFRWHKSRFSKRFAVSGGPCNLHDFVRCTGPQSNTPSTESMHSMSVASIIQCAMPSRQRMANQG